MQFPTQVVLEITVPNNVPFEPGFDVIGIGTQLPPAVIAAGYPAAILFYSSSYDPTLTVPQIKYQFIADKDGTIYFGYGLVANASVSQAETIVTYEGHGFAGTSAQSQFNNIQADAASITTESVQALSVVNSLLYQGEELSDYFAALQAQINSQSPLGMIAYGVVTAGPFTATGAVKIGMFYIGANLTAGRTYRLVMTPLKLNYTTANATAELFINFTTNGTIPNPTVGGATNQLISTPFTIPQFFQGANIVYDFTAPSTAQWNFLFGIDNTVGNHPASAIAQPPGSTTLTISDIGATLPNTAHTTFTPPPPAPTHYDLGAGQHATATHAYLGNGSLVNTNQEMYQGQSPFGPNGIESSDAFFSGTGPGTLGYMHTTGAVAGGVDYIKLGVTWRHWYFSSGGVMRFGYVDAVSGYHFLGDVNLGPAPSGIVLDLTGSLAQVSILNGNFVGFTFGYQASCPAGNYNYYGYMDGAAQASPPNVIASWSV